MADHTHISGNTLASIHGCGTGISLGYDSDNNLITDNVVLGSSGTSRGPLIRYRPGTDDNAFGCSSDGISVFGAIGPFALTNGKVGNELIQLPNLPSPTGLSALSSDNNVIERNTVTQVGPSAGKRHLDIEFGHDGVGNIILNNTVSGGLVGIQLAGGLFTSVIPGSCTGDPSRYCTADAHCFISGVDTTSKGTCSGASPPQTVFRIGLGTRVEHNQLLGSFNDRAMSLGGQVGSAVIANTIQATAPYSIALFNHFLEEGMVTHNSVNGPTNALRLSIGAPGATFFGAKIAQNDFTAYTTAVRTVNDYAFPSELSSVTSG
jgi:hypothetical protein